MKFYTLLPKLLINFFQVIINALQNLIDILCLISKCLTEVDSCCAWSITAIETFHLKTTTILKKNQILNYWGR